MKTGIITHRCLCNLSNSDSRLADSDGDGDGLCSLDPDRLCDFLRGGFGNERESKPKGMRKLSKTGKGWDLPFELVGLDIVVVDLGGWYCLRLCLRLFLRLYFLPSYISPSTFTVVCGL